MTAPTHLSKGAGPTSDDVSVPSLHRSGAVARMLRMPVATLRVWERRYGLTAPQLSPSGQRLYSADDVRRLALIKQLTDLGHAIGSLAPLNMPQLQHVAAMHAEARSTAQGDSAVASSPSSAQPPSLSTAPSSPTRPWRLAVIGATMAKRLQRPALLRRLGRPVALLGPFDSIGQAAASLRRSDLDALVLHEPRLHEGSEAVIHLATTAFPGAPIAVLYGFAADTVCEAVATAGAALLREPQPDAAVAQWLRHLSKLTTVQSTASERPTPSPEPIPPRRWDDTALADFADLSSTIACECPRHVAELLMLLSHFEAYSAECEHRNTADAALHASLRDVAAASRVRFEAALEQVAMHEGLLLPPSLPCPPTLMK